LTEEEKRMDLVRNALEFVESLAAVSMAAEEVEDSENVLG